MTSKSYEKFYSILLIDDRTLPHIYSISASFPSDNQCISDFFFPIVQYLHYLLYFTISHSFKLFTNQANSVFFWAMKFSLHFISFWFLFQELLYQNQGQHGNMKDILIVLWFWDNSTLEKWILLIVEWLFWWNGSAPDKIQLQIKTQIILILSYKDLRDVLFRLYVYICSGISLQTSFRCRWTHTHCLHFFSNTNYLCMIEVKSVPILYVPARSHSCHWDKFLKPIHSFHH